MQLFTLLTQLRHLKQEVGNLPKGLQFINKGRQSLNSGSLALKPLLS